MIGCQVLGAVALGLVVVSVAGASAVWMTVAGSILGAWAAGVRIVSPPDRAAVRRMAAMSGAAHGLIGATAYFAAWLAWPGAFAFPAEALLVVVPGVGAAVGLVGLVAALCGLDAARAAR